MATYWEPVEIFSSDRKKYSGNICPICEEKTYVQRIYKRHVHNVNGEQIAVRAPVNKCKKCGEEWTNTKDGTADSFEKAYLIHAKRKYPLARRFRKLTIKNGKVYGYLCMECYTALGRFRNQLDISGSNKGLECGATGCGESAVAEVCIGEI